MRPDKGEHQAAVGAVVLHDAGGQRRPVGGAAPDHAVNARLADDDRIAGVHPPHVRADRALEALRVVAEHEGVVAVRVGAQLGVVLVRSQRQRRPARPAPDDLGAQPLLLGGVLGVLMQVLAEGGRARVQLAEDRVGAVAAQHLRLRDGGHGVGLVLVAQDELARLERLFVRVGAGNAAARDGRMADAVGEAERVAQVRRHVHVLLPDGHDAGQIAQGVAGMVERGLQVVIGLREADHHEMDVRRTRAVSPSALERSPPRPPGGPRGRPCPAGTRARSWPASPPAPRGP